MWRTGARFGAVAPWSAGIVSITIWGATPAATKFAVDGIDPIVVGFLRTIAAGLLIAPALRRLKLPLPQDRRGWGLLLTSAVSGFVAFPLLFSLALAHTSTARAALILAPLPIFTGLIGAAVERRWLGRWWWAGVALAFVGGAVLVCVRDIGGGGASPVGDLLALGATVSVASGYVAGSRLATDIGTWSVTAWGAVLGTVLVLPPLIAVAPSVDWSQAGAAAWGATLYLALFSSLLAYVAWYWALGAGGIARISLIQHVQPVVTLGLAVALFGETLTPVLLLSTAAILAGVAIARRG
jgi:drug/metabolite transporter (DMT)-like permease